MSSGGDGVWLTRSLEEIISHEGINVVMNIKGNHCFITPAFPISSKTIDITMMKLLMVLQNTLKSLF
jgi:hypothetical protein